jgi:hypothetical protein
MIVDWYCDVVVRFVCIEYASAASVFYVRAEQLRHRQGGRFQGGRFQGDRKRRERGSTRCRAWCLRILGNPEDPGGPLKVYLLGSKVR